MCGFVIANKPIYSKDAGKSLRTHERRVAYRGPDDEDLLHFMDDDLYFAHFLLAIRGHRRQPEVSDDGTGSPIVLCWNGEIYNTPAHCTSDTEYLMDFIKDGRPWSELEGEFIICFLQDGCLTVVTDAFATKSGYFICDVDRGVFGVASYPGVLRHTFDYNGPVHKVEPNTCYTFDVAAMVLHKTEPVYTWDFEPKKNYFDDWLQRFSQVILERATIRGGQNTVMLPLSSGYDSGAVLAGVIAAQAPVEVFCFRGQEDQDILNSRISWVEGLGATVHILDEEFEQGLDEIYDEMVERIEPLNEHGEGADIFVLKGCTPMCYAIKKAKGLGCDIFLSGQGADEIYSDYSTRPLSTSTGGDFTNVREPWPNLFGGRQAHYIQVTERMTGAWGMEGRYPFLDRQLTQEFLWLTDELKNKEYKQCLAHLMRLADMPFNAGVKSPWSGMQDVTKFKRMHAAAMKRHGIKA